MLVVQLYPTSFSFPPNPTVYGSLIEIQGTLLSESLWRFLVWVRLLDPFVVHVQDSTRTLNRNCTLTIIFGVDPTRQRAAAKLVDTVFLGRVERAVHHNALVIDFFTSSLDPQATGVSTFDVCTAPAAILLGFSVIQAQLVSSDVFFLYLGFLVAVLVVY